MSNEKQHIPLGYKASPLGIIPEDWEVKRLGEIGEVLMCKRIMKYQTDSCGDIPFFKIGTFGGKPDAFISRKVFDEYKTKYSYPKIGDVLISAAGTIGRTVIFNGTPSYYQDSNIVWIDNDNKQVLNKYLYYYYSTINWITDTGTIPRLYNGALKAIQIPTPPIEQQTRIVSILELWDTAIAKQTALIENLTLRKRGLMQQLLTGNKRLKGFEGEWKEVRLGKIGVFFKGGGVPKNKIIDAGNKCLTYGDLYTKYDFVISDVKSYIDDDTANESVKIRYGDICFAGSGETKEEIGKCAAFIDDDYGYAGGDIIVFRANDCNPITLSYILNSGDVIRQKSNMGQGHSVVHIYPYQLEKLIIKIPSRVEQDAISTILTESDKEIEIQKQKLSILQEQKKGLMQVLLTGKKRIKK
ncbi:MAG: restriction endonuclease subunit S [Bacteroidales bacterium]|nr:restriction endonuclease subunit S [Bacteroidales bacterium]